MKRHPLLRAREWIVGPVAIELSPRYWSFGVQFSLVAFDVALQIGPVSFWTAGWMWRKRAER